MKIIRLIAGTLFVTLMGLALFMPAHASAASPDVVNASTFTGIPLTGTVSDGSKFSGTLDITKFVVQNNQVVAQGIMSGTLTSPNNTVLLTVTKMAITAQVAAQVQATTQTLVLTVDPLDIVIASTTVDIALTLNIPAQQNPALGPVLSNIAKQQNTPNALASSLNQVLSILG
jgi:hypothetical protein